MQNTVEETVTLRKCKSKEKGFVKQFLHAKGRDGDLLTRPVIIPHNEHKFTM